MVKRNGANSLRHNYEEQIMRELISFLEFGGVMHNKLGDQINNGNLGNHPETINEKGKTPDFVSEHVPNISDFRSALKKLNELGIERPALDVIEVKRRIDIKEGKKRKDNLTTNVNKYNGIPLKQYGDPDALILYSSAPLRHLTKEEAWKKLHDSAFKRRRDGKNMVVSTIDSEDAIRAIKSRIDYVRRLHSNGKQIPNNFIPEMSPYEIKEYERRGEGLIDRIEEAREKALKGINTKAKAHHYCH